MSKAEKIFEKAINCSMHHARDYEVRIRYSPEPGDECFVATVVEWPGISAHGDTREEAAHEIEVALDLALQVARDTGIEPPAPQRFAPAL